MTTMTRILTGPDSVRSDDASSVRVQLVAGALEVVPRDEPGVLVEVTEVTGQPLEVSTEADRVSIGYPSIGWDGWLKRLTTAADTADRAVVRLHVGAGVTVTAATVSAAVRATGTTGDLDVSTASAPVETARTTGGVKVRTASGAVAVDGHAGPVTVATASSDVRLDGELPRVSVTTVAGGIDLRHRGDAAVLSTTTVSGHTHVHLPAAAALELEARGVAAQVSVDGHQQRAGFGITKVQEAGHGGRVLLTATTVSGEVVVERKDPSPLPGADGTTG